MDMLDTRPSARTRRWRALGATVAAALVAVPVLSVATAAALTPLTITLTVTDTSGGSAETSFVVTFDDVPEDPTLAPISDRSTGTILPG